MSVREIKYCTNKFFNIRILMDLHVVILYAVIIALTTADDSPDNLFSRNLDGIYASNEDTLPSWEDQREVLKIHLCNVSIKDPYSECQLIELLIQKLVDNPTINNELVHLILNGTGSDLYGAAQNETVDSSFADNVISNFISMEVFGDKIDFLFFLIDIVSENVTIARDFKEKIKIKLTNVKVRDSNSTLSRVVVDWVADNIVYPLLPNVNETTDILSFDYAYAQAGTAFARSFNLNLNNISSTELIQLSQMVEISVQSKHMDVSSMQIFMLPVLLRHCHKYMNSSETIKLNLKNGRLNWAAAYNEFFSEMNEISQSPVVKFFSAMSTYRHRRQMAEDIINENCTKKGLQGDVTDYLNGGNSYYCFENRAPANKDQWETKLSYFLSWFSFESDRKIRIHKGKQSNLQDITRLFKEQNRYIAIQFKEYDEYLITEAIKSDEQLKNDIENRTIHRGEMYVKFAMPQVHRRTGPGPLLYRNILAETVDLFGFSETHSSDTLDCSKFYAIVREESGVFFTYFNKNDPRIFYLDVIARDVANINYNDIKIHCIRNRILKRSNENTTQLAISVATPRASRLEKYLTESGMDETGLEKFTKFLTSLIPFYDGIQKIIEGDVTEGIILLFLDTLSFIPFIGYSAKISYGLLMNFAKVAIRSILAKHTILSAFRMGLASVARTSEMILFSRAAFLNIGKSILRAIDPGFELVYIVGKSGLVLFRALQNKFRIFSLITDASRVAGKIAESSRLKIVTLPHLEGVRYMSNIGTFADKNVYVKVSPLVYDTKNFMGYGYKYLEFPNNKYAELRRLVNQPDHVPVQMLNDVDLNGRKVYAELDVTTGETNGLRLIENKNGKLQYTIVESKCMKRNSRSKREEMGIVHVSAGPAEIIADALSCSVDEAKVLIKQYFLDNPMMLSMVAHEIRHLNSVPEWLEHLRIRFPELIYGREINSLIDTPQLIANAHRSIREIYTPEELLDIGLDIDRGINSYNTYQSGVYMSFEDYFAFGNFGHNGFAKVTARSNEGVQIRNAFRRLTIRQSSRLRRSNIISYVLLPYPIPFGSILMREGNRLSNTFDQFVLTSNNLHSILTHYPIPPEGVEMFLVKLDIASDYLVADVTDIMSNLIIVYGKDIPFYVKKVETIKFPSHEHLGELQVVTLAHDPVDRLEYIMKLMNSIE